MRWEKICCYNPPGKGVPNSAVKECAELGACTLHSFYSTTYKVYLQGIHVVPNLHPDVTHHLTPTYALTPSIATSLLSAVTLVKPDWLSAVLAARLAPSPPLGREHSQPPQRRRGQRLRHQPDEPDAHALEDCAARVAQAPQQQRVQLGHVSTSIGRLL